MLNFLDYLKKPKGYLRLKIYKEDTLVDTIEGDNLIVDEGSDLLGNGLISSDSDDQVETLVVGTGSGAAAAGDDQSTFTSPSPFTKAVATSSYSSGTQQLTYTFTLEASEYNGNTIKEFGLMSNHAVYANKQLFARRVLTGSIVKAADTRVEGTWIIQF